MRKEKEPGLTWDIVTHLSPPRTLAHEDPGTSFCFMVVLRMKLMNVFSTTRKRSTVKSRPSLPSYTRSVNVVFQGNPRNVFS